MNGMILAAMVRTALACGMLQQKTAAGETRGGAARRKS
jgi:hypothetical protein